MHQNYYFLKQVTKALEPNVTGMYLAECYSQRGDEVVLAFTDGRKDFYIKAVLSPGFSSLAFPEEQAKPKRFFVNLFKEAFDKEVVGVRQYLNERSFEIQLKENYSLVFQFFGRRSNILLVKENEILSSYKKNNQTVLEHRDRAIDQTKEAFMASGGDLKLLFPTFGKKVLTWLADQSYEAGSLERKWEIITQMFQQLNKEEYFVEQENDLPVLTFFPATKEGKKFNDPLKAVTYFTIEYLKQQGEGQLREKITKTLNSQLVKLENYIQKGEQKLQVLQQGLGYREMADIIMANLHQINPHVKRVELFNFYNNKQVEIPLKKDLSPQKNAENYYRKAKNQQLEVENLKANISQKSEKVKTIQKLLKEVATQPDYYHLRKWAKVNSFLEEQQNKTKEKPFKEFEVDGFTVYVGKNAANNDLLTLKFASKEDLWLHAKDVSGSHTVIKIPAGKKIPKHTLETVAAIAAYYSKRKTESLCPVIYTPKKYVRKRKGAPAGQVVVEREQVVLVKPSLPNS